MLVDHYLGRHLSFVRRRSQLPLRRGAENTGRSVVTDTDGTRMEIAAASPHAGARLAFTVTGPRYCPVLQPIASSRSAEQQRLPRRAAPCRTALRC